MDWLSCCFRRTGTSIRQDNEMHMTPDKPTNDTLNLCRYCRALLERVPPADLVADPETWDGVMEPYKHPYHTCRRRGVLSTEAVSKIASRGCIVCIQLLGDATTRPTRAIDLVKEPQCAQADQGLIYWRMMNISDDSSSSGAISFRLRKRGFTPLEMLSSDRPLFLNDMLDEYDENSVTIPEGLYLFPSGCEKEDLVNTAPIHDNTASEPTFSNIIGWLDCCLSSHAKCWVNRDTNPGYLPKRVVCLSNSMSARLLLVNDNTPILPYTTLSHCWGTSEKPLRLFVSNFAELQSEIPPENLSRTFLDAFEITWRMGLRYIWIDSLCIIQDNEKDWLVESAAMGNTYSNSYCNIAAAHARNGSEGCFIDRNSNAIKPLTVTVSMGFPQDWAVPTNYFTIPRWNLDSTPLTKRAWVCQELYLAPRVLYFCADQVYSQCLSPAANESFPRDYPWPSPWVTGRLMSLDPEDHPDDSTRAERGLSAAPWLKVFRLWEEILKYYSGCDLTFATDKLVAISGLAKRLQPLTGNCRYLAGLWEKHLPYHLLWESGNRIFPPVERYENYVAPSWTWASIRGRIMILHSLIVYEDEHDVIVKVLEASVTLVNADDPFGQVTGGFLQLECYLSNSWSLLSRSNGEGGIFWEGHSIGWLRIDVTDNPYCGPSNKKDPLDKMESLVKHDSLWLLPILVATREELDRMEEKTIGPPKIWPIEGLVVETVDIDQTEFRRVGRFRIFSTCTSLYTTLMVENGNNPCAWGPRRVITLI